MRTPRSIIHDEMKELGVTTSPYWSDTHHWGSGELAAIYDILYNLTTAFEYWLVRDDLKARRAAVLSTLAHTPYKDLEKMYAKKKDNDAKDE